ncbi:MAG: ribosome small subunit-dependent GTPase A [Deltaproteobacteria bacterium]
MFQKGIVRKRTRSFYYVDCEGETRLCRVKGNLFQESRYDEKIAVGDLVEIDLDASEDAGWIHKILPRKSRLSRHIPERQLEQVIVANADQILIVASLKKPDFRNGVVDRLLVAGLRGDLEPILILNKTDLGSEVEFLKIRDLYNDLGYRVLGISAKQGIGIEEVRDSLKNKISVLAGHSGVGKSSLVKALYPDWEIRIGAVNQKVGKGRHTTTLAEMFPLPEGGFLVDTPGVRELRPWDVEQSELDQYFVEFDVRENCHFSSCSHRHEPNCAVLASLEAGQIHPLRYNSYLALYNSLEN